MIPAGQRNQFITIQYPPAGRDALGQAAGSWTEFAQVWARARPARSREIFSGGTLESVADVVFGINWLDGVTSDMRVLWRGVPHYIVGMPADVDGGRHTLEMMCSAGIRQEVVEPTPDQTVLVDEQGDILVDESSEILI